MALVDGSGRATRAELSRITPDQESGSNGLHLSGWCLLNLAQWCDGMPGRPPIGAIAISRTARMLHGRIEEATAARVAACPRSVAMIAGPHSR